MEWGYFIAWSVTIFVLFWVTGWPVTPELEGSWGNHHEAQNLTYYGILYFHYFIGALFFSFFILGLLRGVFWKGDKSGNRQLSFLLAYSFFVASIFGMVLAYRYTPEEDDDED